MGTLSMIDAFIIKEGWTRYGTIYRDHNSQCVMHKQCVDRNQDTLYNSTIPYSMHYHRTTRHLRAHSSPLHIHAREKSHTQSKVLAYALETFLPSFLPHSESEVKSEIRYLMCALLKKERFRVQSFQTKGLLFGLLLGIKTVRFARLRILGRTCLHHIKERLNNHIGLPEPGSRMLSFIDLQGEKC